MAKVTRMIGTDPAHVFAVLADGWSYPLWVVGASHMRDVDAAWPEIGSRIHHSVGLWPLLVEDFTEVVGMQPDRHLELAARAWPTGSARITIDLEDAPGGTVVTMAEHAEAGPAALIPGPLETAMLVPRNREALARLDRLATRRRA